VAKANGFASSGPDLLTERERQIATCFSIGLTNKETAYQLGVSHSTVRVLAARAAAKLGAKDRDDFVARFRRACLA
jgi:DNA-binding CsgD family transcriptional regulator